MSSRKTCKFALSSENKPARFYLLPKVHKPGVPGRPVVSTFGSITRNLSVLVDSFLKPLIPTIPSYIRDTNHFLENVRGLGSLPKGSLLVTLDVVSLYPSIPHSDGLAALSVFLDNNHFSPVVSRGIVSMAHFVLTHNFFSFCDSLFLQIAGTAIGSVMAVCYAIIFMHVFECSALEATSLKPYVWWRFIDDIFAVWTHGEDKLLFFVDFLNSINPNIKFTLNYSPISVNFLDVKVILSETGEISTDLFIKPTDTHQFLLSSSCHPGHVKSGIAFSQALRIKRICSDPERASTHCRDLEEFLCQRGHNRRKVRHNIRKALIPPPNSLSSSSQVTTPKPATPFVLTYHSGLPNIKSILGQFHPVLMSSPTMRAILPEPPMLSFRRPKNLRDSLVRAKVPPVESGNTPANVCGPCNKPRCQLCAIITPKTSIVSSATGRKYLLFCGVNADCSSENCVYCLTCLSCRLQYVGCTNNLRLRLNNHKSCVRTKKVARTTDCFLLYKHFRDFPDHSFDCTILECVTGSGVLTQIESRWIYKLRTFSPLGLNMRDDV